MAEVPEVRKGQTDVALDFEEFAARFRARFFDPAFDAHDAALDALTRTAWKAYDDYRRHPRTRKAGPGFADPEFELSIEWLEARDRIEQAALRQRAATRDRVLVVCASPRTYSAIEWLTVTCFLSASSAMSLYSGWLSVISVAFGFMWASIARPRLSAVMRCIGNARTRPVPRSTRATTGVL